MKSKKRSLFSLFCILALLAAAGIWFFSSRNPRYIRASDPVSGSRMQPGSDINPYPSLSVPSCITKIREDYFIVDTYHDQILFGDSLKRPIEEWRVVTDQISRGHTIAGDGTVYLADDTENNRILVFEKKDGIFLLTQEFTEIGTRPHYVVYDEETKRFYAYSSMTGELYVFLRLSDSSQMVLEDIRSIPKLNGIYVRSFTIMDQEIYFVSGNSSIIRARLSDLSILEEYPVTAEIAGMIQLEKIQDYYYITVSTDVTGNQDHATILRTHDLHSLADGEYEDIYSYFVGGGTPYYLGSFDGHYYLTEHRIPGCSIWQFDVVKNEITNVTLLY
ncbi:MAG TPA: hypothetical protein H9717_08300 [Candidatus Eisenbergiella merdipullorum]|uniref:6-bladed beta-propeller n=1 Tax=Candidatus Eisenbergiella merdipullorum TaxID=2838553 RepID=A0A9D2I541_9FIRM|nr:hypothetical protein [Candidatus Eisenbergiella merdipullorum]